jgi:hypothetical protein
MQEFQAVIHGKLPWFLVRHLSYARGNLLDTLSGTASSALIEAEGVAFPFFSLAG